MDPLGPPAPSRGAADPHASADASALSGIAEAGAGAVAAGLAGDPAGAPRSLRIIETVNTVITALILAFVMRAFFVEAFIIPTGSMAESLLGVHGTRVCDSCGWRFDFGPEREVEGGLGPGELPSQVFCPNCHRRQHSRGPRDYLKPGDRILVHKWPYALSTLDEMPWLPQALVRAIAAAVGPHRWDVIVFRDPANPSQNYIKRLVGLPGESIEIIDGDVYIDGAIARKTRAAQSQLWFVVFDQDHLPADPQASTRSARWVPLDAQARGWRGLDRRIFEFTPGSGQVEWIGFQPGGSGEYLLDVYGYNRGSGGTAVNDARVRATLVPLADQGELRVVLVRDGRALEARLSSRQVEMRAGPDLVGHATASSLGRDTFWRRRQVLEVEFGYLDRRLYCALDGRNLLSWDEGGVPPVPPAAPGRPRLDIRIGAAGMPLELHHVRIDRDVYYTTNRAGTRRAFPGSPFRLGPGEYFVLGDNSPHSHDSREWSRAGPHLDEHYRLGTVSSRHIVGQAFFVYLPGLERRDERGWVKLPDVGRTRWIR